MPRTMLRWILPVLLAAFLVAAAVLGVSAHYSPASLLTLAALYLLLSFALVWGAGFLARLGPILGFPGALAVVATALWHLREQTNLPDSLAILALLSLVLAVPYYLLHNRLFASEKENKLRIVGAAAAALGFLALWVGAYQSSPLVRWHLLRHNTMLGTPAHYLLDDPVLSRKQALFEAHRQEESTSELPREDASEHTEPEPPTPTELSSEAPNLVFVMIDTLRADALAAYGGDPEVMPRLNRFFDGAYRFTDVVANASWTRPSVASFFTGLLPEEHGARLAVDPLAPIQVTLAEVLQARGFRTAAFVTNVAAINKEFGFDQGFETFHEFQDLPYARAEKVKRTVLHWLGETPMADDRWFLYLHLLDPHEPYLAGVEPKQKRPEPYRQAYRSELAYLDQQLGEMLDAIQQKLQGPTWIFVTSDHGEEFFEHELFGHGYTLYDEVLKIPAALHTGQGSGTDVTARLEARDFFELLLDAVLKEGTSIEEWTGERSRERRYTSLYHNTTGRLLLRPYLERMCSRALEEDGYKLIWSAYGDTWELYDLENDPGETVNLAAAEPERVARMAEAFDAQVRFWTFAEEQELSSEARQRLKALGYLN